MSIITTFELLCNNINNKIVDVSKESNNFKTKVNRRNTIMTVYGIVSNVKIYNLRFVINICTIKYVS